MVIFPHLLLIVAIYLLYQFISIILIVSINVLDISVKTIGNIQKDNIKDISISNTDICIIYLIMFIVLMFSIINYRYYAGVHN